MVGEINQINNQIQNNPENFDKSKLFIGISITLIIILLIGGIIVILYLTGVFESSSNLAKKTSSLCTEEGLTFNNLNCKYFLNGTKYWTRINFSLESDFGKINQFLVIIGSSSKSENIKSIGKGFNEFYLNLRNSPEEIRFLVEGVDKSCWSDFLNCIQIEVPVTNQIIVTNVSSTNTNETNVNAASENEEPISEEVIYSVDSPPALPVSMLS